MTKFVYILKSPSSAQTVAKQRLRTHLKRIRNREYIRLRNMVPAIANKQKVSKLTVIEEAVRYIDELHRALASRLINTDIQASDDNAEVLKTIVHSFVPSDFYERKAPAFNMEKHQKYPSYLTENTIRKPSRLS